MYYNLNGKCDYFTYKRQSYYCGTKLIYNGKCCIHDVETILNNKVVTYLYYENGKEHFQDNNNNIYTCPIWEFEKRIVKIVKDTAPTLKSTSTFVPEKQQTEIYWTNDMVAKTLWYIIIMLAAVIFKDCIGIWILATIIWYNSTFKKKK